MGRTIAVFNQKGGVGKTTTVVNAAAALGLLKKKVLVVDMDPQGNTTSAFGKKDPEDRPTTYEWLIGEAELEDTAVDTEPNVRLVPANANLAGLEIELAMEPDRESVLWERLGEQADYDFVFLDCPPSLGLLSLNALTAADSVLIPIQTEYYAVGLEAAILERVRNSSLVDVLRRRQSTGAQACYRSRGFERMVGERRCRQ
nr:CobQ/CobB/MinD/ParA nucleotide binding domain protein [uncultured bacterium]